MTDEQLVQFAKEQMEAGKGFAVIQTDMLIKYGKTMGEANHLLDLAKVELGMAADTTEEDIKEARYAAIGISVNLLSWIVFLIAVATFFLEGKSSGWGEKLLLIAFILSGIAIYLRQYIKVGFFRLTGFAAKALGVLITLGALTGLLGSCQ